MLADLVYETSTSTGTGNFTLSSVTGWVSFNNAFGTGGTDAFYYFIRHKSANEWEVGTGHLSASTTLVRDTVIASSNSDAAVSFSAGTKEVTCDLPASLQSERGTFTPTLTFNGAAVGMTGTFLGKYTFRDNVVEYWLRVALTLKGSSTGNAVIGGLPYTSFGTAGYNIPGSCLFVNLDTGVSSMPSVIVAPNSTDINPFKFASGTVTQLTDADFEDNTVFQIAGHYYTA